MAFPLSFISAHRESIYYLMCRIVCCRGRMTSYRLEISDQKWNKFKDTLSKNQTINQVIESWIDERIEEAAE